MLLVLVPSYHSELQIWYKNLETCASSPAYLLIPAVLSFDKIIVLLKSVCNLKTPVAEFRLRLASSVRF